MPSSTRKRGAPLEDDTPSSPKKPRTTSRKAAAQNIEPDADTQSKDPEGLSQAEPGDPPLKKVTKGSRRKEVDNSTGSIKTASKKTIATTSVTAETPEINPDPAAASPKQKSRKRVKIETEEEERIEVKADSAKKTRKRKVIKREDKVAEEQINGEDVAPKKPKRKRKTQEEKDAEAMPLAARTTGLRMFFGAHVSGAKGVQNAVTNCVHIGGNAFALFLKSQRKWENPPLQDEHRDGFKANCIQHQYDATKHIVPHGSYLVNLAQEEPAKAKQAYDCFLEDLHRCEALGIKLYNFHPGTTNNQPRPAAIARIASALNRALSDTHTITPLLETMAGSGNVIGSTFADLASIIALIKDEHKSRIGICLDTCHLFAAGYDLRSPSSFSAVMRDLDSTIGMKYVKAVHLNDSKAPFGSRRDLHANIGTGFLGLRGFWNVVNEARFEGLPLVLETPIDRKVDDGDAEKEAVADAGSSDDEKKEDDVKEEAKGKGKRKGPAKAPKEKTVEDKSIWAREIKLLESLIGMDTEGEEFKTLEKDLADQGAEERTKHQEAFDRKLAKEAKMKTKDIGSFFVKVKEKANANGKKVDMVEDGGSPLSELSELSDESEK